MHLWYEGRGGEETGEKGKGENGWRKGVREEGESECNGATMRGRGRGRWGRGGEEWREGENTGRGTNKYKGY